MPSSWDWAIPGVGERPLDDRSDRLHVRPAGQLRDHAAEDPVDVLGEDHEAAERAARPPSARSTAAEVSSQEVSMPRIH